jgi:tetratricopeptide (TPR) repeat protein/DNA-binding MarR family transcriptional regulator
MTSAAPTPLLSLHQLSLYNTGRMSPEQIIAAFAARQQQLERIVADIAAEKPKSRAQHHLIVGQRGMGKTMLLARIAAELRTDPALSARFIPLVFAEEQYSVDRLSKFWLNCLDSLADARELEGDAEAVDEIDAAVKRLIGTGMRAATDDQPFADEVYETFAKVAKASGQRPVLLVDNLQLVFDRLDKGQQHSLRELLMRAGGPILIGASPSPPSQSQDYGAAFYDQFKVHYLRPLDESEMRSLLVHLAEVAERDDVRQRVLQHPARLTVLRQLTGGNPRTALTLFFLYAEDFAPSVFGDLEGLLDRVTPLYKARFEELTPQQQVVASAIANHWDPVTAATLAAATGLPTSSISAQLDRLEKTGVVERTELFGETSTGYQLSERFFNIWFLMRSASRRQRREVEFLTRFLESFYEPSDRTRLARHLMGEDHFTPDRFIWSRAVADSLAEPETAEELRRHAELTALREEARDARLRLRDLIDFDNLPRATLAFDDLRKKLMSLVPDGVDVTAEEFAKAVLGDRAMFTSGERAKLAARSDKLSDAEIQGVLQTTLKARTADNHIYSEEAVSWFFERLTSGQIRTPHDVDDWNRAFRQVSARQAIRLMVDSLPRAFGENLSDSSLATIRTALEPASSARAWDWFNWGYELWALARYADAETAYRIALDRDPKLAVAWNNLAYLLHADLGRSAEAEIAYREAISADPTYPLPWKNLGLFLLDLGRHAEAETAYRTAIALDPDDAIPWTNLGNLLKNQLHRFAEAEMSYRESIARDPSKASPWSSLGNLYLDHMGRFADAAEAYDNAMRLEPAYDLIHQNRLFFRRDFMGGGVSTRPLLDELRSIPIDQYPDTTNLQEALFAAYDSNWGLASEALAKALTVRGAGFDPNNTDDWLRASAVLLHLNYGGNLLVFLDERGATARLRPWVEALRALHLGDRRALQNIAPEIRTTAEIFYDGIESLLKKLPEKTRRRPVTKSAKPKRTRSRQR